MQLIDFSGISLTSQVFQISGTMSVHLVVHLILTLLFAELFHIIEATNKNIKNNRQDVKDKVVSHKPDLFLSKTNKRCTILVLIGGKPA